jgi:hypothetical protein
MALKGKLQMFEVIIYQNLLKAELQHRKKEKKIFFHKISFKPSAVTHLIRKTKI